jgi:hypothetical protein
LVLADLPAVMEAFAGWYETYTRSDKVLDFSRLDRTPDGRYCIFRMHADPVRLAGISGAEAGIAKMIRASIPADLNLPVLMICHRTQGLHRDIWIHHGMRYEEFGGGTEPIYGKDGLIGPNRNHYYKNGAVCVAENWDQGPPYVLNPSPVTRVWQYYACVRPLRRLYERLYKIPLLDGDALLPLRQLAAHLLLSVGQPVSVQPDPSRIPSEVNLTGCGCLADLLEDVPDTDVRKLYHALRSFAEGGPFDDTAVSSFFNPFLYHWNNPNQSV